MIPEGLTRKGVIEDRSKRFAELKRTYEEAKAAGKTVKVWRTSGDDDVRDSHARATPPTVQNQT